MTTSTITPTHVNYRILSFFEQIIRIAPKGTDLGLCDLLSALASGYFIESGGAVMPAVEAFLQGKIEDEEERAARSRRAANALTYGQYNLSEMLGSINECIKEDGQWQPHWIQGYRVMPVDFTAYHRPSVKNLESKAYNSEVGHATPGVQIGMIGTVGCVNGQRIALLQEVVQSETTVNQPEKETARLYQATAKTIEEDEVAVFDAGFSLVKAAESGIEQCVMRLDKNCTFGRTIGQIPDKKEGQGCPPTVRRAEIIRPLARHHKERTIAATPPDEVTTMRDEDGKEVTVHIWRGLYFLERHLATIQTEREKERLRKIPINVMVFFHPDYQDPLVLGTTLLTLTPESVSEFYASRWPIEGVPQTGKYILSGGGGRHYVHHPTAVKRLPALTLMLGTLLKYVAATIPPLRTGFWDRCVKPTYGRLIKHLKKVTIPLSEQLCKKASSTAHFLKGYEAVRVANAKTGS